jgi:hypothetical protein
MVLILCGSVIDKSRRIHYHSDCSFSVNYPLPKGEGVVHKVNLIPCFVAV